MGKMSIAADFGLIYGKNRKNKACLYIFLQIE